MSQMDGTTKEIDGHEYTVYMLDPMKATDLLVDLAKIIGPALGHLADGGDARNLMDQEIDSKFFGKAAQALFSGLDKKTLRTTLEIMSVNSEADGNLLRRENQSLETALFSSHFRGRLGSMAKWLAFCLKVQYGNFSDAFSSAMAGLPVAADQVVSASRSRSTSTGSSGDLSQEG